MKVPPPAAEPFKRVPLAEDTVDEITLSFQSTFTKSGAHAQVSWVRENENDLFNGLPNTYRDGFRILVPRGVYSLRDATSLSSPEGNITGCFRFLNIIWICRI
jgi:hypothetical protein